MSQDNGAAHQISQRRAGWREEHRLEEEPGAAEAGMMKVGSQRQRPESARCLPTVSVSVKENEGVSAKGIFRLDQDDDFCWERKTS
jgi:hypothetical protein